METVKNILDRENQQLKNPNLQEIDDRDPKSQEQNNQDVSVPDGNKWGYSQEEMDYMQKRGYNPAAIDKYLSDFDPNKEHALQRLHEQTFTKPVAPDEKQIRRAKTVAGIGDALGLLSQMFASGRGAHIRNRDYNQSALVGNEKNEKELRNIYRDQLNRYNEGLYNARLKDFVTRLEEHRTGRANIQKIIEDKRTADQKQAQFNANLQRLIDKDAANQKFNSNRLEETQRHNKTSEGIAATNAKTNRDRANSYIQKNSVAGQKEKVDYDKLAATAFQDPEFMKMMKDKYPDEFFKPKYNKYNVIVGLSPTGNTKLWGNAYLDYMNELANKNADIANKALGQTSGYSNYQTNENGDDDEDDEFFVGDML